MSWRPLLRRIEEGCIRGEQDHWQSLLGLWKEKLTLCGFRNQCCMCQELGLLDRELFIKKGHRCHLELKQQDKNTRQKPNFYTIGGEKATISIKSHKFYKNKKGVFSSHTHNRTEFQPMAVFRFASEGTVFKVCLLRLIMMAWSLHLVFRVPCYSLLFSKVSNATGRTF